VRVAALYDVHGNLPALTAVLAEVDALGVDAIVVGGDVASGPMPVETLDALRVRGARFVRGNADRVLDLRGADEGETWVRARRWVAARLGEERVAFLASLPLDLTLELAGLGAVRFCHGAPGSDELTITRLTPDERLRGLRGSRRARRRLRAHARAVRPPGRQHPRRQRGQRRRALVRRRRPAGGALAYGREPRATR